MKKRVISWVQSYRLGHRPQPSRPGKADCPGAAPQPFGAIVSWTLGPVHVPAAGLPFSSACSEERLDQGRAIAGEQLSGRWCGHSVWRQRGLDLDRHSPFASDARLVSANFYRRPNKRLCSWAGLGPGNSTICWNALAWYLSFSIWASVFAARSA